MKVISQRKETKLERVKGRWVAKSMHPPSSKLKIGGKKYAPMCKKTKKKQKKEERNSVKVSKYQKFDLHHKKG